MDKYLSILHCRDYSVVWKIKWKFGPLDNDTRYNERVVLYKAASSWHPQLSYPFRKEKKKEILFGGSKFAGITTMLTMLRLGESAQQKWTS